MEKVTGEELAQRFNIGEITEWRLHWLTCDLHNVMRDMRRADFSIQNLKNGVLADFQARFKNIVHQYSRLRWETKTILGCDYYEQVDALFAHLQKHTEYCESVQDVTDFLMKTATKALNAEVTLVLESIANDAKPLLL